MSPLLMARDITLGFRESAGITRLLSGFNFSTDAGSNVAIIGASGVGKSSLLRVLSGLERPLAGDVFYQGKRLTGPHPQLGMVFQTPGLLPWLNLRQNVAFGLNFHHQPRLSRQQRQQRISQAIEAVGLSLHQHKYPIQLSGGMAQRVALARCLARTPGVLLLDEPFSALDPVSRQEMQQLVSTIARDQQLSVLLVTHDIDEALLMTDRVLLLNGSEGGTFKEWRPRIPSPREQALDELSAARLDILKAMRDERG
mgnify:CR=1 FL=1